MSSTFFRVRGRGFGRRRLKRLKPTLRLETLEPRLAAAADLLIDPAAAGGARVTLDDDHLVIIGTSRRDFVEIAAIGNQLRLDVNGAHRQIDAAGIRQVTVRTGAGLDSLQMTDYADDWRLTFRALKTTAVGDSRTWVVQGVETIRAASVGSGAVARLYDSAGDDVFLSDANESTLRGAGFRWTVAGAQRVFANATSGGYDKAEFHDSANTDRFTGRPGMARMARGGAIAQAEGFDRVLAVSEAGGSDAAYLSDGPGDDLFWADAGTAVLSGEDFRFIAQGFGAVTATASQGKDVAYFYDSTGDDHFLGAPGFGRLTTSGGLREARNFRQTTAVSKGLGSDRAELFGTTGADFLDAARHWASITENGSGKTVQVGGYSHVSARPGPAGPLRNDASGDTARIAAALDIVFAASRDWVRQPWLPATLPIVLHPEEEISEAYGYDPEYVRNVPAFDSRNRPFIRSRTNGMDETSFVQTLTEAGWTEHDFLVVIRAAYPDFEATVLAGGFRNGRIVFDANDVAYTQLTIRLRSGEEKNVLLRSDDFGETFSVHELPDGRIETEHWVGHNEIDGPPPMLIWRKRAEHPGEYADYYDLYFAQPSFENGELAPLNLVHITADANLRAMHSGGSSVAVTRDGRTHFVWAETTPTDAGGAPIWIATYDHNSGTIASRHFLGLAPSANDAHNSPAIAIDSQGYLHVIAGSYESFRYYRSSAPGDITAPWSDPEQILNSGWRHSGTDADGVGRQNYPALVIDSADTLHLVFRQLRSGVDHYHAGASYAALAYQSKPANGTWSENRLLVLPPTAGYSIYYHKLTLDRHGRLYLSLSYKNNDPPDIERPEGYDNRFVLTSGDGGDSWEFATTAHFSDGRA